MRVLRPVVLGLLCSVAGAGALAAEEAQPPESRLTWSGEVYAVGYRLTNAYFGAPELQASTDGKPDYTWLESTARLGASFALTDRISLNAKAAGLLTGGEDPFGLDDATTAVVETANIELRDLLVPGLALTVGRQDIKIGDGFLIQDGYADDRAEIWSIPLKFWDAARLSYARGAFAGKAMVGKLSGSFGYDGELYGVDLAWVPRRAGTAEARPSEAAAREDAEPGKDADARPPEAAAEGAAEEAEEEEEEPTTYLGLGWFAREDSGPEDDDARVLSLRGSVPVGPLTFAGEYAFQSGKRAGVNLGGEAWHADVRWDLPLARGPYLFASYLHYSGDDPDTADDENFVWHHYSADDWSHYYLGELVGSTLFFNTDQDVLKLEAGLDILEPLELRVFYVDIKTDTGAYYGVPDGAGDGLATEWDAVLTWTISDALQSWLLFGQAKPGDASRAVYGGETSQLLQAGLRWTF